MLLFQKIMKIISTGVVLVTAGLAFLALVSATGWFDREPGRYTQPEPERLFSPQAGPLEQRTPGQDTVVLCLHGFKSSPHDFAHLARGLAEAYDVVVPLLPGHGTRPADFTQSYFSQWYACARDHYLACRKRYRRVVVIGFSMGGALALKLGEEFGEKMPPEAIITIAAPVFLNQLVGEGVVQDWRLYFSKGFAWLFSELPAGTDPADQDGAVWVGYANRIFPRQSHSLKAGLPAIARELKKIRSPLLVVHARGDRTVPWQNALAIARLATSAEVQVRLFSLSTWRHSRHLLPMYRATRELLLQEIKEFLSRLPG